jgi:hypothetical protein
MMTFVTWQDAPDRTHAEVLALLDKALELAHQKACAPLPLASTDHDRP